MINEDSFTLLVSLIMTLLTHNHCSTFLSDSNTLTIWHGVHVCVRHVIIDWKIPTLYYTHTTLIPKNTTLKGWYEAELLEDGPRVLHHRPHCLRTQYPIRLLSHHLSWCHGETFFIYIKRIDLWFFICERKMVSSVLCVCQSRTIKKCQL